MRRYPPVQRHLLVHPTGRGGGYQLAVPKAPSQNLVANPGFEANTTFAPWSLVDPDPFGPLSVVGVNPAFAHSGMHCAARALELPSLASLSQTLTTTPGGAYSLAFWLAHDVTAPPPPISNTFQVFFDGVLLQTFTDVGVFNYQQFAFPNLVATSSSTPLEFRFMDTNDFFRFDDVSVSVPEPSATALLALPMLAGLSTHPFPPANQEEFHLGSSTLRRRPRPVITHAPQHAHPLPALAPGERPHPAHNPPRFRSPPQRAPSVQPR